MLVNVVEAEQQIKNGGIVALVEIDFQIYLNAIMSNILTSNATIRGILYS